MEAALTDLLNLKEDRVLIIDLGPAAGRGNEAIKTIGRQQMPAGPGGDGGIDPPRPPGPPTRTNRSPRKGGIDLTTERGMAMVSKEQVTDVLRRADKILARKAQWTQGAPARDDEGYFIGVDQVAATCWSLEGAIRLAALDETLAGNPDDAWLPGDLREAAVARVQAQLPKIRMIIARTETGECVVRRAAAQSPEMRMTIASEEGWYPPREEGWYPPPLDLWNDAPERRHRHVKRLLKAAIAAG